MAIFKVTNKKGKYNDSNTYRNIINYCINNTKTHGYVYGYGINIKKAAKNMEKVADSFGKNKGTRVRHMVLSFAEGELAAPEKALKIGQKIIEFYAHRYQILCAVHTDAEHLHIHFVMNMVSYVDGRKYKGDKKDYYEFQKYIKKVLRRHGICRLEIKKAHEEP